MGLFGNKSKGEACAVFYEGDLPGFIANGACRIRLLGDILYLRQVSPQVEVTLERNRIMGVECLSEQEYMQKYKGSEGTPLQKGEIPRVFHVYTYVSRDGKTQRFTVWSAGINENRKMMKLKDDIISMMGPARYDI